MIRLLQLRRHGVLSDMYSNGQVFQVGARAVSISSVRNLHRQNIVVRRIPHEEL
jgi:hypothetical protein